MNVGLLRIRPGVNVDRLRADIAASLPPDVRVLTKAGLIAKEQAFWDHVAPIGTVFSIGVVMGFIVGLAICYQVLFSDVSERLAEFATLKAIGYSDLRLFSIIVTQSVYLAMLGYLAGLGVSPIVVRGRTPGDRLADGPSHRGCGQDPGSDAGHVRVLGLPGRARLASADPAQLFH